MKFFIDEISSEIKAAFAALGCRPELGRVTISKRPDLCEFQCNGAMSGAKEQGLRPMELATKLAGQLKDSRVFSTVDVAEPGFLNLSIRQDFVRDYLLRMAMASKFGIMASEKPLTILVDYGGPNVAKPLHIGHLRSAIIGESVKRIIRYMGHTAVGDIHMGDWGLPIGLIITELGERAPELPYFDPAFGGTYPADAPFTVADLEEIYPAATKRAEADAAYRERAQEATLALQSGHAGYMALWQHVMRVSVADLKRIYDGLEVEFELWKGESDVQSLILGMVNDLRERGLAYPSEGALVMDVREENDAKEIPPCLILKSDGAALYLTTDLATIIDRVNNIDPDAMIYLTDKRQSLHFVQLFRCARKAGLLKEGVSLRHIGFGTMNGPGGKPFKTRAGGVMRLAQLVAMINEEMHKKIVEGRPVSAEEATENARIVGLAALKYGDLSNQATKDYIFDMERFTSFEGDSGPYILYTIVRIKSILYKYAEAGGVVDKGDLAGLPETASGGAGGAVKQLMLSLAGFSAVVLAAYEEAAPHRIAAYAYELANALNSFYHETKILTESVNEKRGAYLALLSLTKDVLETCIDLLGFSAPERM